jgi:DnaJ-class molecular chaperone
MSKTSYEILGLSDEADEVVIRAAYKALAQKYHPDKWIGDKDFASSRMAEINSAYEWLSTRDSSSRRKENSQTTTTNAKKNEPSWSANKKKAASLSGNSSHLIATVVSILTLLLVAFILAKG